MSLGNLACLDYNNPIVKDEKYGNPPKKKTVNLPGERGKR